MELKEKAVMFIRGNATTLLYKVSIRAEFLSLPTVLTLVAFEGKGALSHRTC